MTEAAPAVPRYEPISVGDQSTVVAEFVPEGSRETAYQSEAAAREWPSSRASEVRPTSTC